MAASFERAEFCLQKVITQKFTVLTKQETKEDKISR